MSGRGVVVGSAGSGAYVKKTSEGSGAPVNVPGIS